MKWRLLLLISTLIFFNPVVFAGGTENPLVIIKGFKFIPQTIIIKRGQTLRWENQEKRQYHSVWFEAQGEEEPDYFFPDESYKRTFKKIGSFPYRCGPHPKMIGTVKVIE